MKNMIFFKRGKQIIFDDFVDNKAEYGSYWAEMCPCCYEKYKDILGKRVDDGGIAQGTCCVKGCWNDADYYVDFDEEEVRIVDENGGLDMKSDVKNRDITIRTFENQICEVKSNRSSFWKFDKPFKGEVLEKYVRWTGCNPTYKVKAPNGRIYMVYESEIEFEGEDNRSKNEHVKILKDFTVEIEERINNLYDKYKNKILESNKDELFRMLEMFNQALKQCKNNDVAKNAIFPFISMLELAIELK